MICRLILLIQLMLSVLSFADTEESQSALSQTDAVMTAAEADQMIGTLEGNKNEVAAELKSSLEEVASFYETEKSVGDRKVTLRRIPG